MGQEEVNPGPGEATLADLLPPVLVAIPVAVKARPVLLVQLLQVAVLLLGSLEEVVLDQVSSEQRGSEVVEGLEDGLGIVALRQADADEDQLGAQSPRKGSQPGGRVGLAVGQRPFLDALAE
ncbi:hypothetical protein, partial [Luteococcus sp.]|uniref:hypothetical protein n=1 Tax=Luteococcus sp. TaxID=1969402 RepID=UPI003735EDC0